MSARRIFNMFKNGSPEASHSFPQFFINIFHTFFPSFPVLFFFHKPEDLDEECEAYGALWDNGLFAADMEIDEKELEMLYSENEAVEIHPGVEMIRSELAEYEYYINHYEKLVLQLQLNHSQIECYDSNCGWNDNVDCKPLLPQQVIHVMIYHFYKTRT